MPAALAAAVALGAALRFSTLGVQGYHHDEIITVARVLPGGFLHMLHRVRESESSPPLYYVVAWPWSKLFGTGEWGMRSLSALLGSATIPVAFLAGREALDERAGLTAAAIAAVNPMLIWYSQEARSYAMLVFFGALSLFFFLRVLRTGGSRDLAGWALASAAALCSHYFAGFQVAIEGIWLLLALGRRRQVLAAVGATAAVGLALLPLLLSQINGTHLGWIGSMSLPFRLFETGASFLAGETGHVIAEAPRHRFALLPALVVGAALLSLARRGSSEERRAAVPPLALGLGIVAAATLAALAGKDYVIERNLLPALLPLALVVAIGLSVRRGRRVGLLLTAVLCVYWLGFGIYVALTPNLQRPDFRAVAERLGRPRGPRAIVGWELGATVMRFYLPDRSERVFGRIPARELDVVSKPLAKHLNAAIPPGFHEVERARLSRLTLTRYRSRRLRVVPYYELRRLPLGFGSNGVVADGLAPASSSR
ncbi:MAG: glycosyltransferase family 39 protein [Solirubrobacterales bacterium]